MATKTRKLLLDNVTTTQTSSPADVSADDVDTVFIILTQTGTATTAAQVQVYEQPLGSSEWYGTASGLVAAPLAEGTYSFKVAVDPTSAGVKATYTQQVGGTSSACTAELGQLTG